MTLPYKGVPKQNDKLKFATRHNAKNTDGVPVGDFVLVAVAMATFALGNDSTAGCIDHILHGFAIVGDINAEQGLAITHGGVDVHRLGLLLGDAHIL